MFRKLLDSRSSWDNVGFCFVEQKERMYMRGQVLAKPGSITPHTEFEAEIYVLAKKKVVVILHSLKIIVLSSIFRTTDVTGEIELPAGKEMVMPGDNTKLSLS